MGTSKASKDVHECYSCGPIIERFNHIYNDEKFKYIYNNDKFNELLDFSKIKAPNININLIHYDKNIKSKENIKYYRYFSVNIKGSYYPIDDFDILKLLLSKINQIPFTPNYVLMISGSEAETKLKELINYDFILDIVIFCFLDNKYIFLKDISGKIRLIANRFNDVLKFLESKNYPKEDLSMDNHLLLTPLITYYEYKKCLFPIHRILAYFFKDKYMEFTQNYFNIALKYIDQSTLEAKAKEKIRLIMKDLSNTDSLYFPEKCIKYYTGEDLCYVFNKAMRNFEKFYIEMAHFMGPFYHGIYQYALRHKEKQLRLNQAILYRDIKMERLDLYSYQFSENDIICFPSFTSTTLNENLNFKISKNNNKINNNQIEEKSYIKMIIKYEPKGECDVQGVDISDISKVKKEKEVLLFPFTFLRIDKVDIHSGKKDDKHLIYLTIINKEEMLEYGLNKDYGFKLVENGITIAIDREHDLTFEDNELFYKMKFKYIKNHD